MATEDAAGFGSGQGGFNPIDHIFQFHKALRLELRQLEADAMRLEAEVMHVVQAQPQGGPAHEHEYKAPAGSGTPASGPSEATATAPGPDAEANAGAGPGSSTAQPATAAATALRVSGWPGWAAAVQQLHGRFQFMQGIYTAHSKAEDEIVFPALEAKHALRNVSHAYTLDHMKEESLFRDLEKVGGGVAVVVGWGCGGQRHTARY